jgi:hypothetical protein
VADQPVARLVVLRPAGGGEPGEGEAITAESIGRHAPDPDVAERARRYFAERGFEVGPLVGISFSITGPPGLMEELDLEALPADVREAVHEVATEPPPDFGPGNP